jgi:hypothetical protein
MNSVLALNFTDNTALAQVMRRSVKNLELAPGIGRGYFQSEGSSSPEPQLVQIAYLGDEEWDRRIRELGASGLALVGPVTPPPGLRIKTTEGESGSTFSTAAPRAGGEGDTRPDQEMAAEGVRAIKPYPSLQTDGDLAQELASVGTGAGTGTETTGRSQLLAKAAEGGSLLSASSAKGARAPSSSARTEDETPPVKKDSSLPVSAEITSRDAIKSRRPKPVPPATFATTIGTINEAVLQEAQAVSQEEAQTQKISWMAYIEQELKIAPLTVLWLLKWSLTSNQGNFSLTKVVEATRKFNALDRTMRQKNWPGCEDLVMPGREKLVRLSSLLVEAGLLSEADPKTSTPRRVIASNLIEMKELLSAGRV